ncbi:MAG: hypothetical protein K2J48_02595 [Muribaculaceae bacterium]|nr:hypothetical protein [Muribaculaceae bacterium]MDE6008154.1 hypothetical protein [Muribaculaceae bacterium]MDE6791960.1 hypothetical protein [Muribaculaceae bacterium]
MITDSVIKEIYKKFGKPHKRREDLRLDYFLPMLQTHHSIESDDFEIILNDLEEFNPFRRFLIRSMNAVLEFDKMVAFVFRDHILFLGKEDGQMRVHMRPEEKKSFFGRIFGR